MKQCIIQVLVMTVTLLCRAVLSSLIILIKKHLSG